MISADTEIKRAHPPKAARTPHDFCRVEACVQEYRQQNNFQKSVHTESFCKKSTIYKWESVRQTTFKKARNVRFCAYKINL